MTLLLLLSACKKDEPTPAAPPVILSVAETERWSIPTLECDAHVVRTAGNVPHIYAHDRADLARAYGFTQARDRYFEMELARRLGLGEVSELLGDAALETDMDSRSTGMTWVADNLLLHLTDEQAEVSLRIARMHETSPAVIREVETVMRGKLSNVLSEEYASSGGVQPMLSARRSDRARPSPPPAAMRRLAGPGPSGAAARVVRGRRRSSPRSSRQSAGHQPSTIVDRAVMAVPPG